MFDDYGTHERSRLTVQKQSVRSLFDSIAYRYDLLNHLLSGGIDLYWRRRAVEQLRGSHPESILDVATGTADFAIAAAALNPRTIIGVDIAEEMLALGRAKLARKNLEGTILLLPGDAECLEFRDHAFDAAIVAFGARNFERLDAGLSEMRRVLRPGGTIVVLEFSLPGGFPMKPLYILYFRYLVPVIGRIVSRRRHAYTYLPETVMKFPQGEAFLRILERAGFGNVCERRLTFGIATMYSGKR